MSTYEARNKQVVERYWDAHFRRDWEKMATFFASDAHYTDVGLDAEGATGPDQIIARLKLGIDPLKAYWHFPKHLVAEGDIVVTEHTETWVFGSGPRDIAGGATGDGDRSEDGDSGGGGADGTDGNSQDIVVDHPFTSVMEIKDGLITRWHDYSHLPNLLDRAPAWWLEHIAQGFVRA